MSNWLLPSYYEQACSVLAFNKTAQGGVIKISPEIKVNQQRLIKEESEELFEAFNDNDGEAFVKELCDLFVVTSFMLYLESPETFGEHNEFVANNRLGAPPIGAALGNLADMLFLEDHISVMKVLTGLLTCLDFDGKYVLNQVNANNMTKFEDFHKEEFCDLSCRSMEELYVDRYEGITWKLVNNKVVYTDSNGKVLKPLTYQPLKLTLKRD